MRPLRVAFFSEPDTPAQTFNLFETIKPTSPRVVAGALLITCGNIIMLIK